MVNAIEIQGLRKEYRDFSLHDISFALPLGHIMGFVGQNGAGKTTTIRLILNMTARQGGSIQILGLDNILDEQKIKQDIAVVFDDTFFAESWKVSEVEKAIQGFYAKWNSALYHQYVKEFNLPIDKRVNELSRGMKMKLMLAVAMSHEAKLLILDEPTSGIDPVARDELLDILRAYVADGQKSIFFSTHITTDLQKIADYISIIHNGGLVYTGTEKGLSEAFPGVASIDDILVAISKRNI
jgi:ABC-2 type transport system ATP-binding protein